MPQARLDGQVTGVVELTGVVRRGEQRAPFMPKNTEGSILFTYRQEIMNSESINTVMAYSCVSPSVQSGKG